MIFVALPGEKAHRMSTPGLALDLCPPSFVGFDGQDLYFSTQRKVGMSPHPGIDTDAIKDKAKKDLLDLLEGVCKACPLTDGSHAVP